jgi:hypothetical protein
MNSHPFVLSSRRLSVLRFLFTAFTVALFSCSPARPQASDAHHNHADMTMPMNAPLSPTEQAKLLSDKRESEFNHHLAGSFLFLAGLVILSEFIFRDRAATARYVWPICFLLSGLFVLVFSDTELWPFGPKPWIQGVITNHEVLQHKTFAVMLLVLGSVELVRARNKWTAAWTAWVFPVCAVAGSILLLFHSHDAGMLGTDPEVTMARIQMQHFSYSGVGMGIGVSKGLSEVRNKWQPVFNKVYPALMILLGVLLMAYVE